MTKRAVAFILSLGIALVVTFLLKEPNFSDSQVYVLFLLFFSIGLWVTEAIPPFSVGLFILAYLVFALGNPRFNSEPQDIARYVNTFSSGVIWLMLGGFFLAAAATKTGLDADLLRFAIRISGPAPRRILMGLMLTAMTLSMVISNTATTAMVIAAVMPLLTKLGKSPLSKALLVGIPLAASVGGMGTIIGSPPNLIAGGALEHTGAGIDFLDWMSYGLPLALVLTSLGYVALLKVFVRDNKPVSLDFLKGKNHSDHPEETRRRRRIVVVVLTITLLLWATSSLHSLSVSAVSAIPIVFLTMTGVLDGTDIRGLPWDTLLLVAGGLSLGLALQETGLLNHYASKILDMGLNEIVLLIVFAYVTMLCSNVMSNTATSTLLIPLCMAIVPQHKTEAALIIGLSASTALFLPVSTPPNAIAYSTGLMDQKDFRIGGTLIGILGPVAAIAWVLFISR